MHGVVFISTAALDLIKPPERLCIDPAGNPAIAFYDATGGDLYYMRATDASGVSWGSPVLVAGGGSDAGQYCQMTMISGWPAVTYFDDTANELMFCRANNVTGSSWST